MERYYVLFVTIIEGKEVVNLSAKTCSENLPESEKETEVDFNDPETVFIGGRKKRQEVTGQKFAAKVTEIIPAGREGGLPTVICRVLSDEPKGFPS